MRAVSEMVPDRVRADVVRGQYGSGWVEGKAVEGYREEPEVDPESETETFIAARLEIDDWRWARRPVLPSQRQAPAEAGDGDRDPVQGRAPPAVPRLLRGARAEPARDAHPARRGDHAALRREGPGARHRRPLGEHGLHLRLGVHGRLARRVRDADPRRAARRRVAVHPGRRGRGRLVDRHADHRDVGDRRTARRSPTTRPARGVRTRRISCWPAMAEGGGGSSDRVRRPHPARHVHARRAGPAGPRLALAGVDDRGHPAGARPHLEPPVDAARHRPRSRRRRRSPGRRPDERHEPRRRRPPARDRRTLRGDHPRPHGAPPVADADRHARRPRRPVLVRREHPGPLRGRERERAGDVRRDDLPDVRRRVRPAPRGDRRAAARPRPAGDAVVARRAAAADARERERPRDLRPARDRRLELARQRPRPDGADGDVPAAPARRDLGLRDDPPVALAGGDRVGLRPARHPAVRQPRPGRSPSRTPSARTAAARRRTSSSRSTTSGGSPRGWGCASSDR